MIRIPALLIALLLVVSGSHCSGISAFADAADFLAPRAVGAVWNGRSCGACHFLPAAADGSRTAGGFGHRYLGVLIADDAVTQIVIHRESEAGVPIETAPAGSNLSIRIPPQLFGLGLVQQVPASAFDALALANGGRRLGRFGSQGQTDSLVAFVAGALSVEIGRPPEPMEAEALAGFISQLPAPTPAPPITQLGPADLANGEALFASIGCASCHTPTLTTASGITFAPYSDFLLHDLGPGLDDGVALGAAQSFEWRTTPLWGYGHRVFQGLHDGRANYLHRAVAMHGGEAAPARAAWSVLTDQERIDVTVFARSR